MNQIQLLLAMLHGLPGSEIHFQGSLMLSTEEQRLGRVEGRTEQKWSKNKRWEEEIVDTHEGLERKK